MKWRGDMFKFKQTLNSLCFKTLKLSNHGHSIGQGEKNAPNKNFLIHVYTFL